jgi:hypothetical protein
LELGDASAAKPPLPHAYALAEYLGEPPPRDLAPALPLLPAEELACSGQPLPKLTEAMLVHFSQVISPSPPFGLEIYFVGLYWD